MHRVVIAAAIFLSATVAIQARQGDSDSRIETSLARYAAGNWDEAVKLNDVRDLTVGHFLGALDRWIRLDNKSGIDDRRRIACAFALDAVWTATRGPLDALRGNVDPWGVVKPDQPDRVRLTSYVSQGIVAAWAAKTIGQTQRRPEIAQLERLLFLGAIAVASDGSAWHRRPRQDP